jgi:flagellar motor switch/type III secretory pathway protein FliN
VELGRTTATLAQLLDFTTGSLIELPASKLSQGGRYIAEVRANGALAARGEVVCIGESFGVRIVGEA